MDALKEHLAPLGLHWLANVRDAVRLNQVCVPGMHGIGDYVVVGVMVTVP